MGAIDTTTTFTANDTITSAKMNDILDQSTVTGAAIFGTTLEVAAGQLKVRSQGITSKELANNAVNTLALADAAVTPAKLSLNGPNWDGTSTQTFGDRLSMMSRNVVGGAIGLEIGQGNTIDQYTFVDFHATATGGIYPTEGDANARIAREQGINGEFQLINSGTGRMGFVQSQAGAFAFNSSGIDRMFIGNTGIVNIPNALSVGPGSPLIDRITCNGPIFIYPGTTNSYANVVELANRTNTYLGFAGAGGTTDWAYLRQISSDGVGANDYTLAFDLHDDANDPSAGQAFAIRQVGSSTNQDAITTNFIVDKYGNVGVGTDAPINFNVNAKTLHILGSTDAAVIRTQTNVVTGDFFSSQDSVVLRSATNHPILFATNGVERARLTTNGNFGIGETSPTSKLDVAGQISAQGGSASSPAFNISSPDTRDTGMYGPADGILAFSVNSSEKLRILSSGNIGIGTATPSTKLQVDGVITATSFTGNVTGNVTGNLTGTASAVADGAISAPKLNGNQSGAAPIYGARAWVNFNGVPTVPIITSQGNVYTVTRVATGRYEVTFAIPMSDSNYAVFGWARDADASDNNYFVSAASTDGKTASSFVVEVNSPGGTVNSPEVNLMVIR